MKKLIILLFVCLAVPASAEIFLYDSGRDVTITWPATENDYYSIRLYDMTNGTNDAYKTFDTYFELDGLITHNIYSVVVYAIEDINMTQIGQKYFCFAVETAENCICNCPALPEPQQQVYYATTGGGWWTGVALMNSTNMTQTITLHIDDRVTSFALSSMHTETMLLSTIFDDLPEGAHVITADCPTGTSIYLIIGDGKQATGQ